MYGNIIRSGEYKQQLLEFVRREYGIDVIGIYPAKRGFFGETWRLDTSERKYFLKLDYSSAHQGIYERSFPVIEHLNNHGIDFISRIVNTADGKLSVRYDGAVLGMFDWVEGENIETDETKIPEYRMLAKVYTVPASGLAIPREDFSGKSAGRFFEQWRDLDDERLLSFFEEIRASLEHRAKRLEHFSNMCRGDTTGFVITHGDAGGNMIVNGDKYTIIDWDEPILAPPERDVWNMLCHDGKDWSECVFHKALRENGIVYTLRPERLAYYCYYYFFYYLTEFLDGHTPSDTMREIELRYLNSGWIENRIGYADRMF
ncbi:MAG: aminoglycoside phosphotransferase family protein [Oscillospiraceae bacterium]|nr:aminoglycoside phosphotransferase family protein [Oscillospiraceae bacterium]